MKQGQSATPLHVFGNHHVLAVYEWPGLASCSQAAWDVSRQLSREVLVVSRFIVNGRNRSVERKLMSR